MVTPDLAGRTALVTGSSRGVGAATALALSEAGARVCVHYHRGETEAHAVLASLAGKGHCMLRADLTDPRQARRLVEESVAVLGHLDILVNNAGVFLPHPADGSLPFDDWLTTFRRTLAINLVAPAATSWQAIQHMRGRGGGKIVNIGSRGAYRGEAGQVGYGAAKAGLHSLTQSLAREVGAYGITVHAIAPGFIETAMGRPHLQGAAGEAVRAQSPLNRVARTDEVAAAVRYLVSDGAEFTTGSVLDLNGASYLH